ncbi:MAG: energy-coupling factor transporter transmembrane protein EcfT [Anaerolineales bacterium]|nr:energy-coupling factor transporter transmembrane protein EcfT [Anaerolineales bacterium]
MFKAFREKFSVEYVKREILRTTYGNRETFLAQLDPRVLLLWYLVFALLPWFFYNRTILLGLCLMLLGMALLTRVSSLILIFLAVGVVGQIFGWSMTALFFGGNLEIFWSLTTLILKLLAVSLASIAIFASLEPDRLSDALLALGMPGQFAFGMSYGYRMIPVLIDEYHHVINAYRLRGKQPEPGFLRTRQIAHYLNLMVRAFYPMILNTAKRIRTTVEGLEIKGFTYAVNHPEVKKLKLQHLRVDLRDYLFLASTVLAVLVIVIIGLQFPT